MDRRSRILFHQSVEVAASGFILVGGVLAAEPLRTAMADVGLGIPAGFAAFVCWRLILRHSIPSLISAIAVSEIIFYLATRVRLVESLAQPTLAALVTLQALDLAAFLWGSRIPVLIATRSRAKPTYGEAGVRE